MSLEMNANLTKMYDFAKTAIGHEALSGEDSVIQTRRNAPGLVGRKWTKASATRASTRIRGGFIETALPRESPYFIARAIRHSYVCKKITHTHKRQNRTFLLS